VACNIFYSILQFIVRYVYIHKCRHIVCDGNPFWNNIFTRKNACFSCQNCVLDFYRHPNIVMFWFHSRACVYMCVYMFTYDKKGHLLHFPENIVFTSSCVQCHFSQYHPKLLWHRYQIAVQNLAMWDTMCFWVKFFFRFFNCHKVICFLFPHMWTHNIVGKVFSAQGCDICGKTSSHCLLYYIYLIPILGICVRMCVCV
jgi:hypothetical protein